MRNFLLIAIGLFSLTASAQNNSEAKSFLDESSKKMQSFQTMTASFSFTMENAAMNIKEQNSGALLLKGNKYQVSLPGLGMQVFSDGKTVWNFMQEANQVTLSTAGDESQGVIDPTVVFNVYKEGYSIRFLEEKVVKGKTITLIELIPGDKNKEFTKLTVGIEKSSKLFHSLTTHGKDGNLYGITVNEIRTNQPVSDSEFVFDKQKYPGVAVVDFR